MKRVFFFNFLLSLFFCSCVKEKQFPVQPVIKFEEFITYLRPSSNTIIDSANCIISFTDGDGDIGILKGDTSSPANLQLKYLYKKPDGKFYPVDAIDSTAQMDTLFFNYRIPNITPDGQYKALEGKITARMRTAPIFFPGHKVVKFEIILRDRAGNKSNMVTTNEINVP